MASKVSPADKLRKLLGEAKSVFNQRRCSSSLGRTHGGSNIQITENDELLVMPCCFDALSAKMIERAGRALFALP